MNPQAQGAGAPKTVLLIGGTGKLGQLIARDLLDRGVKLRLLVRPGSRGKLATGIADAADIVEDAASAFDGMQTVVSVVQGHADTIVDAQLEWLRAAGVRRVIASDYSMNLFGLAEGENLHSDYRREFARRAEQERGDVEVIHVLNGAFLDRGVLFGFLGAIDLDKGEAYLWGDGNEKMAFTTYADTAAYTAEAALDDRPVPDKLFVAGDLLTFHELVAETQAELGRKLAIKKLGTMADLDAAIPRRPEEQQNPLAAIHPTDVLARHVERQGQARPADERPVLGGPTDRRA